MITTAQKVFKGLDSNDWKPLCLVVGVEPFQANEILSQFKKRFVGEDVSQALNYEVWDGEGLNAPDLINSLDMLPGLFSVEEEIRLIVCQRFDKVAPAHLELIQNYFNNPSNSTVFLMFAEKVDKRKGWYKAVDDGGDIIEIREPYDREWPKWAGYFEKKYHKRIEPAAWELMVSATGRCLSFLASEIEKISVYVGDKPSIQISDVQAMGASSSGEDVFALVEDFAMKRKSATLKKYDALMRNGESDIKLLSIIVRQFRMLEQALRLSKQGITDPKTVASQIGSHPFFVSKIFEQMKKHNEESVGNTLNLLAQCDYQIKTGDGNLFERLLIPYFTNESY